MNKTIIDLRKFFDILKPTEVKELYFDDVPYESFVYSKKKRKPTLANYYLKTDEEFEKIENIIMKSSKKEIISKITNFVQENKDLSIYAMSQVFYYLVEFIPLYPCPNLKYDIKPLKDTISMIWQHSCKNMDKSDLILKTDYFYRFFEHIGEYNTAIKIIKKILKIEDKYYNQGILLNNLGFEYFLQQNFKKGKLFFKKAMKVFRECNNENQYYNSFCNYMFCELGLNNIEVLTKNKREIAKAYKFLKNEADYQKRKPLILLAKIEEKRNNYKSAIILVEKALKAQKKKKTKFYYLDKAYSKQLNKLIRNGI